MYHMTSHIYIYIYYNIIYVTTTVTVICSVMMHDTIKILKNVSGAHVHYNKIINKCLTFPIDTLYYIHVFKELFSNQQCSLFLKFVHQLPLRLFRPPLLLLPLLVCVRESVLAASTSIIKFNNDC